MSDPAESQTPGRSDGASHEISGAGNLPDSQDLEGDQQPHFNELAAKKKREPALSPKPEPVQGHNDDPDAISSAPATS